MFGFDGKVVLSAPRLDARVRRNEANKSVTSNFMEVETLFNFELELIHKEHFSPFAISAIDC